MRKTVDARGLACPQPVVLTLEAIAAADQVTTIVDDRAAVENVTRLARSKGFSVAIAEQPDGVHLTLSREGAPVEPASSEQGLASSPGAAAGPLVIFAPSDCLGRGPAELGERLMGAFFHAQLELVTKPKAVIFMNSGVKLTVAGSRALDDLRALESQGVEILACGTCLSYFQLTEKLAVGRVSNMYEIATTLLEAGKVIEL